MLGKIICACFTCISASILTCSSPKLFLYSIHFLAHGSITPSVNSTLSTNTGTLTKSAPTIPAIASPASQSLNAASTPTGIFTTSLTAYVAILKAAICALFNRAEKGVSPIFSTIIPSTPAFSSVLASSTAISIIS